MPRDEWGSWCCHAPILITNVSNGAVVGTCQKCGKAAVVVCECGVEMDETLIYDLKDGKGKPRAKAFYCKRGCKLYAYNGPELAT